MRQISTTSSIDNLAHIPGLRLTQTETGLSLIHCQNDFGAGQFLLQGAQLLEWSPTNQQSAVWLSPHTKFTPGKSPRGGTPICWPWFGAHESQPDLPAHGFVRAALWTLAHASQLNNGGHQLIFSLIRDAHAHDFWPHNTPLEIRYKLDASLEIELITKNDSAESVTLTEALHTYFGVGDVRNVTIRGLEGIDYLDKVDAAALKHQAGTITISEETDRVYLSTSGDCFIEDPGLNRIIRIEKRGSLTTIVWNPWKEKALRLGDLGETDYLNMVCVESGNAGNDPVTLRPEEEHRLWVRYSVLPLTA